MIRPCNCPMRPGPYVLVMRPNEVEQQVMPGGVKLVLFRTLKNCPRNSSLVCSQGRLNVLFRPASNSSNESPRRKPLGTSPRGSLLVPAAEVVCPFAAVITVPGGVVWKPKVQPLKAACVELLYTESQNASSGCPGTCRRVCAICRVAGSFEVKYGRYCTPPVVESCCAFVG